MSESRMRLMRIGANAFSVLGGDVLNKAGIFLVYAQLSRSASVYEFGQLSLGLLLMYTFHVFAVAGLPISITRQVARKPATAKRLLRHGYIAAACPAMLSVLGMCGLAVAMQYEYQTTLVIALLSLAVPPYAFAMISEAVIKGREQMHLITIGNVPGNLFLVTCSFAVLQLGYGVPAIAGVVIVSRCISLLTLHMLLSHHLRGSRKPRLHWSFSWLLLRRSMVFLGTDGVHALGASLFGLMLSKFASEREVGLLGASFQILQPIQMFYRSVGHSCFPPLVAAARISRAAVGELGRSILGLILRLAFPAALAVFVLAGDLLAAVYGNAAFRSGAVVLQILAFSLLLDPMNPILGHGLWAVGKDKTVLGIVLVNFAINAVLGFALIRQFGLSGAACASLAASLVNMAQHYWYFETRVDHLHLSRELTRIVPAAIVAIACLLLPIHRFASLPVALTMYMTLAFLPQVHDLARKQATHGASGA